MARDGQAMLRPLAAALLLAAAEIALVLGSANELFLTNGERWRYAAAAVTISICVCVLAWSLASAVVRAVDATGIAGSPKQLNGSVRAIAVTSATICAPVAAILLWLLTDGRRLRDLPARPVLVVLAAAVAAAVTAWVLARVARRVRERPMRSVLPASGFVVVALGALAADAMVLRRLYPALHWALWGVSVGSTLLAAVLVPGAPRPYPATLRRIAWILGLCAFAVLPAALYLLRVAPNAGFVAERRAPLTGKFVRALRHAAADHGQVVPTETSSGSESTVSEVEGIDLRDQDVLLITIDALRADRLKILGGEGATAHIDRLASESMVFRRAYTPTPHTSYALASLLTGKYLKPVLELPEAPEHHPPLPILLRRYGYRTAAFYPPSIFYVDAHRFERLRERGFGFEYRKRMFASAHERVDQLKDYLGNADAGHPLFVWVHLFEPHEPYEPPERYRRGDSAVERYNGEVRLVDEAVADLVETFRDDRSSATVILTSDHGEEFGDHGGHYHGTTLYDEQVRVPLLWSSPGVVEHAVVDAPVEIIDVTTTLLAALGVPRDARMRGDDLGPVLAGHPEAGPEYAFSETGAMRMVTDGRYKAICTAGEIGCRLYDLVEDPRERRNLGPQRPERVDRLREALGRFVGSIPRVEAMAMAEGVGWPKALARGELGDPTAAPEVVPLLGDDRAEVRAAAARTLGKLGHAPSLPTLARLRTHDPDARVRAEAAIASLELGDEDAQKAVRRIVRARRESDAGVDSLEMVRRAALALAGHDDATGVPELSSLAADGTASERRRVAAIDALGRLRAQRAVSTLIDLLDEVRLRSEAARALGRIGDRRAAEPLVDALEQERYVQMRTAEARALMSLGHPRTASLVRRFLGTTTGLPGGVKLLLELGALRRASGSGADIREAQELRLGRWDCSEQGCVPGSGAELEFPAAGAPRGPIRAVFRVRAPEGSDADLRIGRVTRTLRPGVQEVGVALEAQRGRRSVPVSTDDDVRVIAVAIVPQTGDIAPPQPQSPPDAGAPE